MNHSNKNIIQSEKEPLPPQKKCYQNFRDYGPIQKKSDIRGPGISKGENKENEAREIFEETTGKNFPDLWKYINS